MLRTEGDTRAAGRGVGGSGVGGKDGAVRVGEDPRPLVPAPLGPFHALRYRNFRLFFVGQLVSVAGSWMQTVAQQWLVFTLTHSAAWLGIVSGASAIPYVVFSVWGGQAADRHERRGILVWTQSVMMVLAFALAALAHWHLVKAWHIAALAAIGGVVNAYNMPAQHVLVTEMVDDREALGNAIALNSLRFNLARFVGPILAGAVLVTLGMAACFFLNGLSFIAVIVSLLLMRLPTFTPTGGHLSPWGGFQYIRRTPRVLRTVALVSAASLFAWSVSTLFPLFAARFHSGASGFSVLMSANGIGAALGGLTAAFVGTRVPRKTLVYGGAFLFAAALLLLAAAPTFALAAGALVLSGFAMIVFGISANTFVQEEVPDALRGRVMAIYALVFAGLMPVGGLEIGFLAERLGEVTAVAANAAACLIVAAALLAWSLKAREARE